MSSIQEQLNEALDVHVSEYSKPRVAAEVTKLFTEAFLVLPEMEDEGTTEGYQKDDQERARNDLRARIRAAIERMK